MEPKARQNPEAVVREIKRNTCRKYNFYEPADMFLWLRLFFSRLTK